MREPKYQAPRPPLSASVRRAVEVESGHACAVARCGEHTYLEIHHINGGREDNLVENLVLLCDKHYKMAHSGVIDQKALHEYKRLLSETYSRSLVSRLERLEALLAEAPKTLPDRAEPPSGENDPGLPSKTVAPRSEIMAFTVEQLALAKFERDNKLYLERQPRFSKGSAFLRMDAVRQDAMLKEDLVVEVRWLRKRYLDALVWVQQVEATTSAYELITGRDAKGVLILIVLKDTMKASV